MPEGQIFATHHARHFLLFSASLFISLLLTMPSISGIQTYSPAPGSPDLRDQHLTIEGRGPAPEYYQVCTGVVRPGERVSVPITEAGPDLPVARAPYLLPAFWFVRFAGLEPLPAGIPPDTRPAPALGRGDICEIAP